MEAYDAAVLASSAQKSAGPQAHVPRRRELGARRFALRPPLKVALLFELELEHEANTFQSNLRRTFQSIPGHTFQSILSRLVRTPYLEANTFQSLAQNRPALVPPLALGVLALLAKRPVNSIED